MTRIADDAAAMFLQGYNCAQAVLANCGQSRGLSRETAIRVGQAFGGGVARTGELCGAVTGALMSIGLTVAAVEPTDMASKVKAYAAAQAVMDEFKRRHGTLLCRELTGCDLCTAEGLQRFKDIDAHNKLCPKFVRDAAEIVEAVLAEREGK